MAHFSSRTAWDTSESDLAGDVRRLRASGQTLLDLTVSNPTECGFVYDERAILGALGDAAALHYDPNPRGMASARAAVALYYGDHGAEVAAEALLLTTSTSEAYSFLFRLLCDPGDSVVTGQPGYPLFDFLATLDDVVLTTYPLFYDFGWWIDFAELERRITGRTRAVVVVHPNNPTGHATGRAERTRLEELCLRHGLALIVDEVFLDYPASRSGGGESEPELESFACGPHPCLTFVISGISKVCALPQMKAGWIAVFGPAADRRDALARLEVIADTFLSMNAPVQLALPQWLEQREMLASQVRQRVAQNLAALQGAAAYGIDHLPVEAGWSAIVRLPARIVAGHESELAMFVLRRTGVLVHPGSFYGLGGGNLVVVSLIVPVATLEQALESLCTAGTGAQAQM